MGETFQDLLERSGLVTAAQIAAATADAQRTRKRLPETLIDLGFITERRLAEWMAAASGAPLLDPLPEETAWVLQGRISAGIAREMEVVPVRMVGNELFVAIVNPLDTGAIGMLSATTGLQVRPVTGVRSAIERIVNRLYPLLEDHADITMLPRGVASQRQDDPFEFSSETIMRSRPELEALVAHSDEEYGTISSMAAPKLETVEERLQRVETTMQSVQKRLDEIDAKLTRILQQK